MTLALVTVIGLKQWPILSTLGTLYHHANIPTVSLQKHSQVSDKILPTFVYLVLGAGQRYLQHKAAQSLTLEVPSADYLGMPLGVEITESRILSLVMFLFCMTLFSRKGGLIIHQQMWGRKQMYHPLSLK